MARRPRLELPGVPLHVIQRGNNRAACFFSDDNRRLYLRCLRDYADRHGCAIHAYVLMSNHVHLLVTPQKAGAVAALMQDVGRRYVRIVNMIHDRSGTLWEGRYKSCLVDSESYYFTCHRYIELNPVRAGMVDQPAAYFWSSHGHYAFGRRDKLVEAHPLYRNLGASHDERRVAFRAQFGERLAEETLQKIRSSTHQGWALGSAEFLDKAERLLGRRVRPPRRGRPPRTKCENDEMFI
jgi:putative transposase